MSSRHISRALLTRAIDYRCFIAKATLSSLQADYLAAGTNDLVLGEECSGHGEDCSLRSAAVCATAARSSTEVHEAMGTERLSGGAHWEEHMRRRRRAAQIFAACAGVNGAL